MPIREYHCANGHNFEIIDISTRIVHPFMECPQCGARAERQVSAPAMVSSSVGLVRNESAVGAAIRRVKERPVVA
jgi:putative FmdB family regulatory protein